jgi:uncharacterized protein YlxW (UPF0749 family)
MRFSDIDDSFVLSELVASPTMIGQTTVGQSVTPLTTTSPQQQATSLVKQKQDQRTQLQARLKQAHDAVTASQKQVTDIQNELSKL